eukprot:CAMPEP_0171461466 /NCGR_PEP_ID=MMETSP0945-20130129/5903_1 /TAXON_ID=109269 /ORGANISM="Vaucheria litorea, Strain CCMP2940" /LENGTH=1068 /DNA_ID=CAMNT_0011987819 /DNA_START=86 /DNA_END=3292 /DNA_ORIENTATION=+
MFMLNELAEEVIEGMVGGDDEDQRKKNHHHQNQHGYHGEYYNSGHHYPSGHPDYPHNKKYDHSDGHHSDSGHYMKNSGYGGGYVENSQRYDENYYYNNHGHLNGYTQGGSSGSSYHQHNSGNHHDPSDYFNTSSYPKQQSKEQNYDYDDYYRTNYGSSPSYESHPSHYTNPNHQSYYNKSSQSDNPGASYYSTSSQSTAQNPGYYKSSGSSANPGYYKSSGSNANPAYYSTSNSAPNPSNYKQSLSPNQPHYSSSSQSHSSSTNPAYYNASSSATNASNYKQSSSSSPPQYGTNIHNPSSDYYNQTSTNKPETLKYVNKPLGNYPPSYEEYLKPVESDNSSSSASHHLKEQGDPYLTSSSPPTYKDYDYPKKQSHSSGHNSTDPYKQYTAPKLQVNNGYIVPSSQQNYRPTQSHVEIKGPTVRMLSGCRDCETSADVRDVSSLGLPLHRGSGGACTSALFNSIVEGQTSWVGLLKRMQKFLKNQKFAQVPQLSTNRIMDLHVPFEIMNPKAIGHRAVIIGINYVGQKGELRGCHNDVKMMKSYLLSNGFTDTPETLCILCDDGIHPPPVAANIRAAFRWLVEDAPAGFSLFLHYSGHGGSIPDDNGDEADGMDETIIPLDFEKAGHIRDDEIHKILIAPLQDGVELTILMDCCHSGTIIDLPYTMNCTGELITAIDSGELPTMDSILNSILNNKPVKINKVSIPPIKMMIPGLMPSNKPKPAQHNPSPPPYKASGNVLSQNQPAKLVASGNVPSKAGNPLPTEKINLQGFDKTSEQVIRADVRMISGCMDGETSADTWDVAAQGLPHSKGSCGACTNALIRSLRMGPTSWIELLKRMQRFMNEKKLRQTPQLATSKVVDLNEPFSVMNPVNPRGHKAVLIGINYVGQKGELKGCHNDVHTIKNYLLHQGFTDTANTMCILLDDGEHAGPTGQNIISAFNWLVDGAEAGDSLFLHYSGHGGSIEDDNGDEEDGRDETIIPVDFKKFGQIRDDDIYKMLVKPLPKGVHFTIVMDCSHAGTIIDLPYNLSFDSKLIEQIEGGNLPPMMQNLQFDFSKCKKIGKEVYKMMKK